MRLLVFSDTHLTDKFYPKKFEFLSKIIDEADQVIINGDFWDGYVVEFDQFVKSEWSKLFHKLKKKKTAYLWGNHDQDTFADDRVKLFSESQETRINLKTKRKELIIEHGNRFLHFIDEHLKRNMIPKSFAQHALDYENFLVRGFGTFLIDKMYKTYNKKMKRSIQKVSKNNQVYICGHTHLSEIDYENGFINTGMIGYGLGQYLTIDGEEMVDNQVWYDPPLIEESLDPEIFPDQTEFIEASDMK